MNGKFRLDLEEKYRDKISVNPNLNRQLVSFQANKGLPFFRWFKYKEGFSAPLVNYLIDQSPDHRKEILLDPFAGSGAALFCAREKGLKSVGIEVLPVGLFIIKTRLDAEKVNIDEFSKISKNIKNIGWLEFEHAGNYGFRHLNITKGAFPGDTERYLNGFLNYCHQKVNDPIIKELLLFALFSILETVSFTRKDGQYLRWDDRANKNGGNAKFNKGEIYSFKEALSEKLDEIIFDISIMKWENKERQEITLYDDSILYKLPALAGNSIDIVITSPPYCNRYDYTRTYALELAFLGVNNEALKEFRQSQLTSTVENREKFEQLKNFYSNQNRADDFDTICKVFSSQNALAEVLAILESYKIDNKLNNSNIVRMVKNYFFEMCLVIFEMFRVIKKDGIVYMVNDNVRYAGETIPVDLILSDFAESAGFNIDKIWILGNGKGNSSQQMGNHGREELRKCLYVWRK
jgi:DNA modification methylase